MINIEFDFNQMITVIQGHLEDVFQDVRRLSVSQAAGD